MTQTPLEAAKAGDAPKTLDRSDALSPKACLSLFDSQIFRAQKT